MWYDPRNRIIGCLGILGIDFDNIQPTYMDREERRANHIAIEQRWEAIRIIDEIGFLLKKRIGINKMSQATGLTIEQIKEIKSLIHD